MDEKEYVRLREERRGLIIDIANLTHQRNKKVPKWRRAELDRRVAVAEYRIGAINDKIFSTSVDYDNKRS